jgi:hypothetical protein
MSAIKGHEPADEFITELRPGQIIVVGTNALGAHIGGAARFAHKNFGLRWGLGEGLSGQTYALPTMSGMADFAQAAQRFNLFAELAPDLTFLLTKVGCGIAGYPEMYIRDLFIQSPSNVIRPKGWPPFEGEESE